MFVGVVWNCAVELKLLFTVLSFLCSLLTMFQFLPSRLSSISDIRNYISSTPNTKKLAAKQPLNASVAPLPLLSPPPIAVFLPTRRNTSERRCRIDLSRMSLEREANRGERKKQIDGRKKSSGNS